MEFTGQEMEYLYVCRRKLWLFRHGIRPEMENELVQLGMLLGEETFSRQEKEIPIADNGVLDWADFKDGVIHEIKRGRTCVPGDKAQVRFYLWLLNLHGIAAHEAVIHYPARRETLSVTWDDAAAAQVAADMQECEQVETGAIPPPERRGICKKCAYEEICFA